MVDPVVATVTLIRMTARGQASEICRLGSATGFFFEYDQRRFLVTNRHVLVDEDRRFYPDHLIIQVHASKTNVDLTREVEVPLYDMKKNPLCMIIGFPMEFYDTRHNLPIVRSGTLATT